MMSRSAPHEAPGFAWRALGSKKDVSAEWSMI